MEAVLTLSAATDLFSVSHIFNLRATSRLSQGPTVSQHQNKLALSFLLDFGLILVQLLPGE